MGIGGAHVLVYLVIFPVQFMKRRSLDPQDKDETDSSGVLTEKWTVPDAPAPPTAKYV